MNEKCKTTVTGGGSGVECKKGGGVKSPLQVCKVIT